MKKAMLSVTLAAQLIGNVCVATTTQWFDDFDRTTMGSDWTWGPSRPTSGVAIVNGVVEITIPTSTPMTGRGWITTFSKQQGLYSARIKGEAIREGADFYFTATDGVSADGVGWCFNGIDGNADRVHFFTVSAAAIAAGDYGVDDDWYDIPMDPRYADWSVTDWHWYSLLWTGNELVPYVDGIRIQTDVYGNTRYLNKWVPEPDANLKIFIDGLSDGAGTPSSATKMYVDDVLFGSNNNPGDSFSSHIWDLIYNGQMPISTALLLGLVSGEQVVNRNLDQYLGSAEIEVLTDHGIYPLTESPEPSVVVLLGTGLLGLLGYCWRRRTFSSILEVGCQRTVTLHCAPFRR